MEERAISGIHMLFAAGMCTVHAISVRDCQITVKINTGFSVTRSLICCHLGILFCT
jgi:hypothetical protein